MTRRPWLALALLAGACASETGIIVEVSWTNIDVPPDADRLRVYVGTGVAGEPRFVVNDGGVVKPYAEVHEPFRYFVRPDGDLAAIGDLKFAAAITRGVPPDAIEPIAFGAAGGEVRFVDGQIGLVKILLLPFPYTPAGPDGECALYDPDTIGAVIIGRPDDGDCDGTLDAVDCAPLDPADASMASGVDSDGVDCGDCLDGPAPVMLNGWRVDPGSVFPGQREDAFRAANNIPTSVACLHIDFDCSGACGDEVPRLGEPPRDPDLDASGSQRCGATSLRQDGLSCAARPSDCDEEMAGHTPITGEAEICDGRDANCDGRPAPAIPCAIDRGGALGCNIGTRACDDTSGRISPEPSGCVDAGFPHLFSAECAPLQATLPCLFDPDPLACAGVDRSACDVGVAEAGPCAELEKLRMPGVPGTGCDWRVVGGGVQGDWNVGFVGTPGAAPSPTTDQCGPALVVVPANPDPQPRTIMIVGDARTPLTPIVARFLTLKADDACDGALSCNPPVFQP
ncbi:MAG: hypothetical protein IPH44_21480 [Myxococcales bacterium]|nr:hypothetical protein [Myxococcales bacterium]MBK7191927.1 hypothetical protein [Myxococcales bacterium]MBP6847054.1 hypothetical protein [Kofleriaceae bacterium]